MTIKPRRWTVGRRIGALALLLMTTLGAVGSLGYARSVSSWDEAERAFVVSTALRGTTDTQHTASVVLADAYRLTTVTDEGERREVVDQVDEHAAEMQEFLTALQQADLPEIRTALDAFTPTVEAALADARMLHDLSGAPSAKQLAAVQKNWDDYDVTSDALKTQLSDAGAALRQDAEDGSRRARLLILTSVLLALPVLGAAMWIITRAVAGPVAETRRVLRLVAEGDFTQRIAVRRRDDLAEMADAVNATLDGVGDALRAIRREADGLASASTRLDGVSEEVSRGAHELSTQAASVSESAGGVRDDIHAVAEGSEQMQASIGEIARNAEESAMIVAEAVQLAGSANTIMDKLGTSSAEIEEVARVITSIADQTNLLALNATIEAARAGEAGKGFAVVASEVKDLAQATARATQGIGSRIETIQTDAAEAVDALHQIATTINRIQEIQLTIAGAVEQQAGSTAAIGGSVGRIADSASDIAERISTVTDASNTAAESATKTRDAAQQVATTATSLQAIVGRFSIPA